MQPHDHAGCISFFQKEEGRTVSSLFCLLHYGKISGGVVPMKSSCKWQPTLCCIQHRPFCLFMQIHVCYGFNKDSSSLYHPLTGVSFFHLMEKARRATALPAFSCIKGLKEQCLQTLTAPTSSHGTTDKKQPT